MTTLEHVQKHYWTKANLADESVEFTSVPTKAGIREHYTRGYETACGLRKVIFNDLLPIIRSGIPVHMLARDCAILSDFFADYKTVSTAWSMNRRSMGIPENVESLIEANGIEQGDYVVDTGFAGTIPLKIDGAMRNMRRDYKRTKHKTGDKGFVGYGTARHALIRSVLISGSKDSFGKSLNTDYNVRSVVMAWEHSPKMFANGGMEHTCVSIPRHIAKQYGIERRAKAYRLGFLAGLYGIPMPRKWEQERIKREQFKAESQLRIQSYQQTGYQLKLSEAYAKYTQLWVVSRYNHAIYQPTKAQIKRAIDYEYGTPYCMDKTFTKREYAERYVKAIEMRELIQANWQALTFERIFPYGIINSATFEQVGTVQYKSYDVRLALADDYHKRHWIPESETMAWGCFYETNADTVALLLGVKNLVQTPTFVAGAIAYNKQTQQYECLGNTLFVSYDYYLGHADFYRFERKSEGE